MLTRRLRSKTQDLSSTKLSMLKSNAAKEEKLLIMNATQSSILTIQEHNQARYYLIFMLEHSNAQRSGIKKGLLASEFQIKVHKGEKKISAMWFESVTTRMACMHGTLSPRHHGKITISIGAEVYHNLFRPIAVIENGGQECACSAIFLTRTGSQYNALGKRNMGE